MDQVASPITGSPSVPLARFENHDIAARAQANWKRLVPIFAVMWYGASVAVFVFLYRYGGGSLLQDFITFGVLVGIFSLVLFGLVARKKAVSTIILDTNGITLVTIGNVPQTLQWNDSNFRLVLWNRDPFAASLQSGDDAGVIFGPDGFQGWTTVRARDTVVRVAQEGGVRVWTWNLFSVYPLPYSTGTLLARRLRFGDKLRGLRSGRPDS
jgi:hypothetical protein